MAKELNEDTGFTVSIKTLLGIGAGMATVISMWFILQADIEEAKLLPEPPSPEITRMEFDMKDQLVRQTIMTTQEDVKEIKAQLEKLNDKIDAMR
ncbi:hypothetical protein N9322_01550 [bacterium]|jgi:hypothetical protein|nr:hypothetical protein [bacterium]|tara:strand:- start:695 stop:979 length:285 start_codon:yes stop_codon:yes gene_type:complete